MNIPIGVIGHILNAEAHESYVLVQDVLNSTGGYLILTSDNPNFVGNAYDSWVLKDDLEACFLENDWQVEWSADGLPTTPLDEPPHFGV